MAKFATRVIHLRGEIQRQTLMALIPNLPVDYDKPLTVTIEAHREKRKNDQNSYYWLILNQIAEQAWLGNRQYSAEVWHFFFKKELLPDEPDEDCLKDYCKWQFDPAGERVLVGSTTMLTKKGFAAYGEAVTAFAANLGVEFSANPNER